MSGSGSGGFGTNSSNTTDTAVVRLVVISDTHGLHESIPMVRGDVLIHCGDMANRGSVEHVRSCIQWLNKLNYTEIVVIDGNHDRTRPAPTTATANANANANARTTVSSAAATATAEPLDVRKEFQKAANSNIRLLQDEHVWCANGRLSIYGASWQSCEAGDFSKLCNLSLVSSSPPDILLAHINPRLPREIRITKLSNSSKQAWKGSTNLTRAVLTNRIPLCCSGHVHWGRGVVPVQRSRSGLFSYFVNASSQKPTVKGFSDSEAVTAPVVIDYDVVKRQAINYHCPSHDDD
mmetsp:Transcript_2521/g.3364  ORF Transcript_2521/g.3364 Transcript_2521/m.3364 type:complete len:293 (-) Transcript_2521:310-1188(-)|eukprot:CAMPEP_0198142792 /NCGR_PEP_ID=MMETSP1443-20131203/5485_1 /TAXON_ID=186043 /ORGANISM="Entomoneis sp., Strain CCMP2396" /LENGTH=292 /DNA_ID=CAMNT_0043805883 /DNA_START=15 /DNA_END=893 /DNA_ORIENTATION=-